MKQETRKKERVIQYQNSKTTRCEERRSIFQYCTESFVSKSKTKQTELKHK